MNYHSGISFFIICYLYFIYISYYSLTFLCKNIFCLLLCLSICFKKIYSAVCFNFYYRLYKGLEWIYSNLKNRKWPYLLLVPVTSSRSCHVSENSFKIEQTESFNLFQFVAWKREHFDGIEKKKEKDFEYGYNFII